MNIGITQNFLHSRKLVSDLISKSNLSSKDTVLEIGPGKGIITDQLGKVCDKVIAVEYDYEFAMRLKKQFMKQKNIEIIYDDILKFNDTPDYPYKLFSNIPFNITSDILSKFLFDSNVSDIYFIMQYEAFLRYAGQPYYQDSYKSLLFKPFFDVELIHKFSSKDFMPEPQARIVLAHFSPKEYPDIKNTMRKLYTDFLSYVYLEKGDTIAKKTNKIFTYQQMKRIFGQLESKKDSLINSISYHDWLILFKTFELYVSKEKKELVNGKFKEMLKQQNKLEKRHRNSNQKKW